MLTVSIVIITRNRPAAMVRQTLAALAQQTVKPLETLVVDTSQEAEIPAMIALQFPGVRILHLPHGPHCMPWSRNQGIAATRGEIVAFLDDDALADPQWLFEIARGYGDDPLVGGVGGRVIEGVDLGGNLKAAGAMVATENSFGIPLADFNSVTPQIVEVAHLKGCNMSFRRSALIAIGGFDEAYDATGKREESDICVRLRRAGFSLRYNCRAAVDHKAFSLFSHKRIQVEEVLSGWPDARLDGYYVAKNFGAAAWLRWYGSSNVRAFARCIKISGMVFARALLGLGGGLYGLVTALRRTRRTGSKENGRRCVVWP